MTSTDRAASAALATRFHQLHAQGLLLLANAWDAGSARLALQAGARAIATSSASLAWAHGWTDGNALPSELLLRSVRAITAAVPLPVSVDIEAGYSEDPAAVGRLVAAVIEAGAVGVNLEDGSADPALLCAKIEAARAAARALGVDLYINARTDVFLRPLVEPAQRVSEALVRGRRYLGAGATGVFTPGVVARDDIAALVAGIPAPLNVMARPDIALDATQLEALGVRRYSAGSAIAEAMYGLVDAMMREFMQSARLDARGVQALSWSQLNGLMQSS